MKPWHGGAKTTTISSQRQRWWLTEIPQSLTSRPTVEGRENASEQQWQRRKKESDKTKTRAVDDFNQDQQIATQALINVDLIFYCICHT